MKENNVTAVPDGYRANEKGYLVPEDMIPEIDKMRDELVMDMKERFVTASAFLKDLKVFVMDSIYAFRDLSAMEYNAPVGGTKGNIQLMSFDGSVKVKVQIHEFITFDERLQVAKTLVDQCIAEWTEGSRSELKVLVNGAFDTDKQGNVSTGKIMGLRRLKIEDPRWLEAMKCLADCMMVHGSKSYVRVYLRTGDDNKWIVIPMDFAAL